MANLVDFVWNDDPVEKNGQQCMEGTARDEDTGALVTIFVPLETRDALDKADDLKKRQ